MWIRQKKIKNNKKSGEEYLPDFLLLFGEEWDIDCPL
jgi:hypothetical protein